MGMRSGWPQPITVMKVGVGSARRSSGVMEDDSVRRYSWQFCDMSAQLGVRQRVSLGLTPQKKCRIKTISWRGAR